VRELRYYFELVFSGWRTNSAIKKMIKSSQRMIMMKSHGELEGMSPPMKKHLELEIKTLQNAPRCRQAKTAFTSKAKT
jgi:hypothetical protein